MYLRHPTAHSSLSKNLIQETFPKIEICLNPGFDWDLIKLFGYKSMGDFARGIKTLNGETFHGWHGNASMSTEDFLENAFSFKHMKSVILEYGLFLGNENLTDAVKILEQKIQYPQGKCFDIRIKMHSDTFITVDEVVELWLELKHEEQFEVKISDPFRNHFLSDEFSFFGKDIKQSGVYEIQIKENIDSEEDSEANCKDYTTEGRGSYKQCVMAAVEEKFLSVYGCMPPWFTENIHQVCDQGLSEEEWKNISKKIFPTMQKKFMKGKYISLNVGQNRGYIRLGRQQFVSDNVLTLIDSLSRFPNSESTSTLTEGDKNSLVSTFIHPDAH